MKKLINDPFEFVDEVIEGMLAAYPEDIKRVGPKALAWSRAPVAGKVGVVVGGGSGHLPAFAGYLGRNMADAVPVGHVFASPPAKPVLEAIRAANGGAGVVLSYGNYAGDVMNFDKAARLANDEGISTETVLVRDDVASAVPIEAAKRRGIAGDFLVFKVLGAKAGEGASLAEVATAGRKANEATRSVGVALKACVVPAYGKETFTVDDGYMEIGMGVHGEPGVRKGPLQGADDVVDELFEILEADADLTGEDVAVLVNGLGATPYEELFLLYRRLHRRLEAVKARVKRVFIGEYVTSLEMAGASLSVMRVDEELHRLISAPVDTIMYGQVAR